MNRHHGFSNVKDTLEEIHKGVSKAYPVRGGSRAAGRLDRWRRRGVPSVRRLGRSTSSEP